LEGGRRGTKRWISKVTRGAAFGLFGFLLCAGPAWPREMVDEAGRRVHVPEKPRRIVSLAPSITESLFVLGLDEEVVGVTQHCNYPPKAATRPVVGSYVQFSLEKVLSLRPDLVLAVRDGNPRDSVERLASMGVPVYVLDPRSLEGLFHSLRRLGELLVRGEEAEAVIRVMRSRLERLTEAVAGRARPKVLLQVGIEPLVTVGRGTLQDHLIELAGGVNVAVEVPFQYPVMSLERVLQAAPEVILVSSMAGATDAAKELRRWQKWKEIPAVASGRVHLINGDLIDRPTPRILNGLEEMVRYIHPEAARLLGREGN